MEVTKIVINGIEITTLDQPIGLEVIKLSLDRDFQYSCIDTTIEVELKFYCASGKEQLDAEYESKGVEGSGYVEIVDECGTNAQTYRFNLDFKKYNNQGDFTTVGLIDINSLWKQDLNKEININTLSGAPVDFYIRNLPLNYDYYSESSSSEERLVGSNIIDLNVAAGIPAKLPFITCIYPKTNTTINDLEDGSQLLSETYFAQAFLSGGTLQAMLPEYIDPSGATIAHPVFYFAGDSLVIPDIEPQPIFDNVLEDGTLTITTSGSTHFEMYFNGTTINRTFTVREFKECVGIGASWTEMRGYMSQLNDTAVNILALGSTPLTWTYNHPTISTKTVTRTYDVKKGEKVWIWYQMFHEPYISDIGGYVYQFDHYQIDIDRDITIDFTLTKNVANSLTNAADIVPYHTLTQAYQGAGFLNSVFGGAANDLQYNICNTDCFVDLWFTRGDYLRGKINVADFIVKPSDFFRELEKVVCCGLGYFYDTNPAGDRRLMSVYDFYSDTLVPSQYQFDYDDLIDGKIELTPFLSPYYKEVQIGYATSKDSEKDFCKQNTYSIDNASESTYSKISDFIASMFVITRAIKLGTEDKQLEFDNNIFLFSGGSAVSGVTTYNATLSQTSSFLADSIFVNPTNSAGINRRYATALNLFRHLYKWGFSLFADKTELKVVKYEGNTIYDWEIRDTTGSSTNPYYHSLSLCKLPLDNYAKVDKSIEDIYTDFIQSGLYVPTQITFKTANLSSLDLIAMRAHQYDLFSVTDGTNIYYGNLISANLEDDVTEIKLLRRFKNGI